MIKASIERMSVSGELQFRDNPGRVGRFIARLPRGYVVRMGRLIGWLIFVLDRRHKRIVRRNLCFVYPEWPDEKVRAVSKDVFMNAAVTVLEIGQIHFSSREDILRKVEIAGKDHLLKAVDGNKGVIVISAHLGNWEMAGLCGAFHMEKPAAFVARELKSEMFDRLLNRARTRFGNIILDKKGALPKIIRLIRKGWLVGILIDQSTIRSEGVEVTFFGKKVTATPAAAIIARRYGCPVLPVWCPRGRDGKLTLFVNPPLELQKTDDSASDLAANTQKMTDAIEQGIRAYPDQWFWFHKRWKRHYPYLYAEDVARRRLRRMKRKTAAAGSFK